MEIYFLDVGQGTSQLILLGTRRAIVIDCGGKSDATLINALARFHVDTIAALVVSHSHDDHVGGAVDLLTQYQNRIEKIWVLQDDKFLQTTFWRRIADQITAGDLKIGQIERLERASRPKLLYRDYDCCLSVFSPWPAENLAAQESKFPNATCAVLVLESRVIVKCCG